MRILNTTTGQIEELTHTGYECDCVPDLITADSTIIWNKEEEIMQGNEDSIAWWRTYLTADAEYMETKAVLVGMLDNAQNEELENQINYAMACDMEDQPKAGMSVLNEWMTNEDNFRP